MNTERLNSWLNLGANLAVLAGLVALVIEIRTNTAAVQAASVQEAANASREYLTNIAMDEDMSLIRRAGAENLDNLTEDEAFRFFLHSRGNWLYMQNVWIQRGLGVLDDRAWQSVQRIFCDMLQQPGWSQDWVNHREVLDADFVAVVEDCP